MALRHVWDVTCQYLYKYKLAKLVYTEINWIYDENLSNNKSAKQLECQECLSNIIDDYVDRLSVECKFLTITTYTTTTQNLLMNLYRLISNMKHKQISKI